MSDIETKVFIYICLFAMFFCVIVMAPMAWDILKECYNSIIGKEKDYYDGT